MSHHNNYFKHFSPCETVHHSSQILPKTMKAQYFDPHYRHKKGAKHQKVQVAFKNCGQILLTKWWLNTCKANAKTTKHSLHYCITDFDWLSSYWILSVNKIIIIPLYRENEMIFTIIYWVTYNRSGDITHAELALNFRANSAPCVI